MDPFAADPTALPALVRRNLEVLWRWADREPEGRARRIHLRFFLRPVAVTGTAQVTGVRFERTAPDEQGGVTGTGQFEDIEAQMVLRSVGYLGVELPGLPFDARRGVVPNDAGRVLRDGVQSPGEYVSGWIKRGPTGVIGSNRPCAKETAAAVLADADALAARVLPEDPMKGLRGLGADPVPWSGWLGIEAAEAELGRQLRRGTVKIEDWPGLLAAARSSG